MSAHFDVRTGRIPNVLTYVAAAAALLFWSLACGVSAALTQHAAGSSPGSAASFGIGAWLGFYMSFHALLWALIPAVLVAVLGGLGGGDMKLLAACGAWLASPTAVLDMAVVSLVAAAAMAVVVMVKKRIVKRTLGNLLGVGLLVASRVKPDLEQRLSGGTVPFAVAVAIGAGCAAAEHLLGFQLPWSGW